jgi:AraC-like DNA-binding protein
MILAMSDLQTQGPFVAGIAIYPPGATFGPRKNVDFEFVWVIAGNVEYTSDGVTYPNPPGSIVLCRKGTTDFFRWDPKHRTKHAFIHFNIQRTPADWPPIERWPMVVEPEEGDTLRPLFQHMVSWSGKGDALLARLTVQHMLAAFVLNQSGTRELAPQALPEAVELALAHMQTRLEKDPTSPIVLEELADAAYVTPEHLCRLFRASTGKSPAETVRLARLDRAATMLARSNYSIAEIAELCGFASPFHFSRRFHQAFGQSPRAIRKRIQAGETPPLPRLLRNPKT